MPRTKRSTGKPRSPQPRGVKAGGGRHVFELAGLGKVEAGPALGDASAGAHYEPGFGPDKQ